MSFKITARTILHLGAELISSDAVAIYELIKNAIDAGSKSGVVVSVEIVISEPDFASVMSIAEDSKSGATLESVMAELRRKMLPDAPRELSSLFENAIKNAVNLSSLITRAKAAYRLCNRIVVTDEGDGMSFDDLTDVFLTIGTTKRTNAVKQAIDAGDTTQKSPYLGEKGVGRLSVMRLGRLLRVETTKSTDTQINILEIDWRRFEDAYDQPASKVILKPERGPLKKINTVSFTRIIVYDLRSGWSRTRLSQIARDQIARMMDPFSWDEKIKFPVSLQFNESNVDQTRTVAQSLLKSAHAHCSGEFTLVNGCPLLVVRFRSDLLKSDLSTLTFDVTDLKSLSGLQETGYPLATLQSLGAFDFEFYWFNRQRLKATEGIGDREAVRGLVKAWTGVSLFRDGYRVLPYGDEGDDWLGLDREALGAGGYKLNTKQIIGRVRIGRLRNPRLLDQTNRQGLTDTPEKSVLVHLLNEVVSTWWARYLDDATVADKASRVMYDVEKESGKVGDLEKRTKDSIKIIGKNYTGDARHLQEVKDAFQEIKDAHNRAVERIGAIEEQKERLTQLAGIGLMIEVIAHELTRATEATQKTLKSIRDKDVDSDTAAAFKVLSQQIRVIQKRLHTLEPLSINARQRRSVMDLNALVGYVLDSHGEQFRRHRISANIPKTTSKSVHAFIVEGHVVQILENLINNSVYWLGIEQQERIDFSSAINVEILDNPPRIRYSDNGPGIPPNRSDMIFEPFFSTKVSSKLRRQGLGLYISRQSAEVLGGSLNLINLGSVREGRFNTFELELKEKAE